MVMSRDGRRRVVSGGETGDQSQDRSRTDWRDHISPGGLHILAGDGEQWRHLETLLEAHLESHMGLKNGYWGASPGHSPLGIFALGPDLIG